MKTTKTTGNEALTKKAVLKKKADTEREDMIRAIREQYPGPKGSEIIPCHLWENNYRVNYWGKDEKGNNIVDSLFMNIQKEVDGYVFKVYK
jgi:hypothetical protein